jgi:hypothetical protein
MGGAMKVTTMLSRVYTELAQVGLGILLLFTAVNLLAAALLPRLRLDPPTARYGEELLVAAYPGWDAKEVRALLEETWSRPTAYEPFVQYTERPFQGDYVNVSPQGYRLSADPGPWPPAPRNLNVFLFGGSTLFGYGVPDGETVASYLQPLLQGQVPGRTVKCYNFGRGSYYSALERTLFTELLIAGHRPDLAIFVDGINEFLYEWPLHSRRLEGLLEGRPRSVVGWAMNYLPALRLGVHLSGLGIRSEPDPVELDASQNEPAVLDARIDRYVANLRMIDVIADGYGVQPVFVVQPTPTYEYDLSHHPFARWGIGRHSRSAFGYPRLRERLQQEPPPDNLVWAADIQRGVAAPLYVDLMHYAPRLSEMLATKIATEVAERDLLPDPPAASSGETRPARREPRDPV